MVNKLAEVQFVDNRKSGDSGPVLPVSAVLVSYNTSAMTLEAIDALLSDASGVPAEVIVVDNASVDGSVAAIRERFPQVVVIENPVNAGFGAANNLGMKAALLASESFLLINTDAFVQLGALNAMYSNLIREPETALVGPKLLNDDGTLQRSCFGFPTPIRAWVENLGLDFLTWVGRFKHDDAAQVDFVSGACFLVRREVFEQTDGFDEEFFMYSEETDWQRRMCDAGWKIRFNPAAQVTHLGGGSQVSGAINPEFFRSLDRYVNKHHGRFGLCVFQAAMVMGVLLRLPLRWYLARRDKRQAAKLKVNLFVLCRILQGDAAAMKVGR